RGARYVGLIGSKRKIKMIFENLAAEGISHEAISKVFAPLGIDIGSQTVPEIAVSICAELIAHRNLRHVPGRPKEILDFGLWILDVNFWLGCGAFFFKAKSKTQSAKFGASRISRPAAFRS